MQEITATDAKNRFGDVLHEVLANKEEYLVKRNGKMVAYIIPVKEYMAWQLSGGIHFEKGAEVTK